MSDSSNARPLKLSLLGSFAAVVHGSPMPRARSQAGQWLLALLALRHDHPTEREWLAALFWPESSHEQALFNLRRNLTDLRQRLGTEAYRLESPTPRTLQFNLTGADCDVLAFDAAIGRSDRASLQEAVLLYRGPLLEECGEEWALAEREARSHAYLTALETLAGLAMEEGNPQEAVGYLRQALAADAYRESALRALLSALAAAGDFTAVTLAYREFRLLLLRELRAEPAPETQELFRRLRSARTSVSRPALSLASRDASSFPSPPLQIPWPVTRLIGRSEEIRHVRECMAQTRLVTLTGPGGIGKTRLALAVAEKIAGQFQDGIWFVDLAPLSDANLVSQAIADCFALREEPGTPLVKLLPRWLANKELLLILDNCEHLLAECARMTRLLLSECPGLRILTTSRQALGLTGETVWQVPSLSFPKETQLFQTSKQETVLPAEAAPFDALQLFAERAREAAPAFTLNERNMDSVVHICRRLDGIALAIELAAARVRLMPVEQIARRLDDRFRLLTGTSSANLPRQQTLRATLDWSHHLLQEEERILLRRLAVFAGGWTLEAAEQVCASGEEEDGQATEEFPSALASSHTLTTSDVLYLLTALVDKSLVIYDAEEEQARYRMLETVRQYALERLTENGQEAERLHWQHTAFFMRLAEEAEPYLSGSKEQASWFERLDRERDNIRAALEWCRSKLDSVEQGLRMGAALRWYWDARGLSQEAGQHLMALLSMERENRRTGIHARALFVAAWLLDTSSAAPPAERAAAYLPLLEEALSIYQEQGDQQGIAFMWQEIGYQYLTRQDSASARRYLEQSLALWREIGDRKASAAALMGLGMIADNQRDLPLARQYYEEAAVIDREYQQRGGWAQANLARILIPLGELTAAQSHAREDLNNAWELENRPKILFALESFIYLAERKGQSARAVRLCAAREAAHRSFYQRPPSVWPGIEKLRTTMPAEAFAAAWTEGYALTLEQTVLYALER